MVYEAIWLTDIHLNFVKPPQIEAFLAEVNQVEADAIFLTGDIGEAHDLEGFLTQIAETIGKPIYFVLGNHDYYHGSIVGVRESVTALCNRIDNLIYLNNETYIPLTSTTALIGHDGWADLQWGNFQKSYVWMQDYNLIKELIGHRKATLPTVMRRFANEAADHFKKTLTLALEQHQHVIAITHVPPWQEACWHEGKISDWAWLPHFTSRATGFALEKVMKKHPNATLDVYCGHTHGDGEARILKNLYSYTGGAEYGKPQIKRIIEVE